jgi:hypothetical protein
MTEHAEKRTPTTHVVALVLTSLALGAFDLLLLSVAVAFGPSGFGGDRTMSDSEIRAAHLTQAAALTGCLLGAAVLVLSLVAQASPRRNRALRWMLAGQVAATVAAYVLS